MNIDIDCPACGAEFKIREWYSGQCPTCKLEYSWDECCTEDYSDCWSIIEWDWDELDNRRKANVVD